MERVRLHNFAPAAAIFAALSPAHFASADAVTNGPKGINSTGLTLPAPSGMALTGEGVGIGQVEPDRPGRPVAAGFFDDAAHSATETRPAGVYLKNALATPNQNTGVHAQYVAGIMISRDGAIPGVAPMALLHSSASDSADQMDSALSANHVATRNVNDIRAINLSINLPLVGFDTANGNSHLSQFIDWSATHQDVLYVVGGTEMGSLGPVPTDNFNGLTVAYSSPADPMNIDSYNLVGFNNTYDVDAIGDRTSVDLIAPGYPVSRIGLGNSIPDPLLEFGTSFSAPHVVGAVSPVATVRKLCKHQYRRHPMGWR
jgi:hypothetical protein